MANQFLIKNTMQDMKAMDSTEIAALESGNYEGVQLLGYHKKGDTPGPIEYYISSTTGADDGGSIILVGSTKFEHKFNGEVNALYFGADKSGTVDSAPFIQKALDSLQNKGGIVYLPEGKLKLLSGLNVHSGISMIGVGYRESYPANTNNRITNFWKEGNFTAIKLHGSSFASDFCLDGNVSTNSGDGLQLFSNNAELYRVIVTGMGGNGVVVGDKLIEGNRNSWKIESVKSLRNCGHGFVIDDYNPGYGPDANAGMALKCNAWENEGDGWYINDCAVNTFIQCYAESNKLNGFHVLSKARRNMFMNCGSEQNTLIAFLLDSGSTNNFIFGAFDYTPVDNGANTFGVSTGGGNQYMLFNNPVRSGQTTALTNRSITGGFEAVGGVPGIVLHDSDGAVGTKTFDIIANNGKIEFRALNDNGSSPSTLFTLVRSGNNLYEARFPTGRLDFNQLGTNQTTLATTLGTVVRRMEIFNASGTSLGYIPIYDHINP